MSVDTVQNPRTEKQRLGQQAERRVRDYLSQQGLSFVEANYLCKMGEIDLIMKERDFLVFVEVRYRKSASFGSAVESVTYQKQKKLIKAAEHYLMRQGVPHHFCRFDVVGLTGLLGQEKVEWFQNAFQAD
jgi:putative endonuclease